MMDTPSPSMQNLALRLLALEGAGETATQTHAHEAVRVCEKLRVSLTRFAGADGFIALLRRALTLARADVPALQAVKVRPDGRLEGLEELVADAGGEGSKAAVAVTARLLGLLAVFIGESLTLRLVRDAWPDAAFDE